MQADAFFVSVEREVLSLTLQLKACEDDHRSALSELQSTLRAARHISSAAQSAIKALSSLDLEWDFAAPAIRERARGMISTPSHFGRRDWPARSLETGTDIPELLRPARSISLGEFFAAAGLRIDGDS